MIKLIDILTPAKTLNDVSVSSKKRALELASQTAVCDLDSVTAVQVFNSLITRERLGSTGIGSGIALPHCRLQHIEKAVGVLLKLKKPIRFDAIDNQPVDIILALLVPEESSDEHLQLLAMLAETFSQEAFRDKLRQADTHQHLYEIAVHYDEWIKQTMYHH